MEGYADLGVAVWHLSRHGCPGMKAVADGLVAAELARGDGGIATFHAVHSGLAMGAIGLLSSDQQQERWRRPPASVEKIGAFALTEAVSTDWLDANARPLAAIRLASGSRARAVLRACAAGTMAQARSFTASPTRIHG